MAIETFTREQFEAALPTHNGSGEPMWEALGPIQGEFTYVIEVEGTNKRITIRSSVKSDGKSAATGQDSIRLWVEYYYRKAGKWIALGKLDAYTTRMSGWQGRVTDKLRKLYQLALDDSKGYNGATTSANEKMAKTDKPNHHSLAELDTETTASVSTDEAGRGPSESSAPTRGDSSEAQSHPRPAATFLDKSRKVVLPTGEEDDDEIEPTCPNCTRPMVLRTNRRDHSKFWGCSQYPKCKETRRFRKAESKTSFEPSEYQKAVFDFIKNGGGHGIVSARAGSGKTTTNVKGLDFTRKGDKVALVAFNRRIARAQAERAPDHVTACTLHSLGLKNIKAVCPSVEVEPKKLWQLLDNLESHNRDFLEVLSLNGSAIVKLVSLCKATLRFPTKGNLEWIADRWGINTNGQEREVYIAARSLFYASIAEQAIIDYDDMIYFCAVGLVPCTKFDFLIVDETQDLNKAQVAMALKSITEDGRIIATGDEFQSIYGFRGADVSAIPDLIETLNATVLPLSISYRCCKAVVRLVNREFPQIKFEAAPGAQEGLIAFVSEDRMLAILADGDLVLCRTNAPLIAPAFELIRRGVKAVILGRDIGKGLKALIHKVLKRSNAKSLLDLLDALAAYRQREVARLVRMGKATRAASMDDQAETIFALAEGVTSVRELERRIDQVFSDESEGVVFSSVHKTKGGEANRVFIIRPDLMPHKMAEEKWELQQEENIRYVAYTRAKKELYFVE